MLGTALELFSAKGYHNVTMHEIAEKAEFAIGTLYKFFENKEDLYKAILLDLGDQFEDALLRAIEETDDELDKIRNYIRVKVETFGANLPIVRLFLAERKGASFNIKARLDDRLQERYLCVLKKLAAIFEEGLGKGRFQKKADPFHLALALDSSIDAFLLLWLKDPEQYPFPEDPNVFLNLFFDNLDHS